MRAWEELLETLEQRIGKEAVTEWLKPIKVLQFDAANLHLEATPFQQAWFEEQIRPLIQGAFFNNNGRPIRIHWEVGAHSKRPLPSQPQFRIFPVKLDPEFTLNQWLPSEANGLAYQMAESVAKGEEAGFNPIFLSGKGGSGKTHLLQAIASESKRKAFYVGAQEFTDHVVQAIRLGHMQQFRDTYRAIDLLLVDDIHLLAKRSATQEEFFHTFNTLHTAGKQIVLSANCHPSQLQEIEPRLISRFEWGISLTLESPDRAALLKILKEKAKVLDLHVSDSILLFLLDRFAKPINALHTLAIRAGSHITLTLAERTLKDLLEKEEAAKLTADKILTQTAKQFGVRPDDLTGKSQMREYVQPRQVAMYLCRQLLQMPYQAIGKQFARDHSTVMTSVKQIAEAIEAKSPLAESIGFIQGSLKRE